MAYSTKLQQSLFLDLLRMQFRKSYDFIFYYLSANISCLSKSKRNFFYFHLLTLKLREQPVVWILPENLASGGSKLLLAKLTRKPTTVMKYYIFSSQVRAANDQVNSLPSSFFLFLCRYFFFSFQLKSMRILYSQQSRMVEMGLGRSILFLLSISLRNFQ